MTAPHYETLTVEKIGEFCNLHQAVYAYFPDSREMPKIPRQWTINVCATLIGDDFVNWVKAAIEERNENMKVEQQLFIDMDPELAEAFNRSNHVARKYSCLALEKSAMDSSPNLL